MNETWIIFLIVFIILLLITVILSLKTDLLRDISIAPVKPFSLSKTQLAFWTVVIVSSYFYLLYKARFDFQDVKLSQSALILLGISLSTAVGGRMIDVSDEVKLENKTISKRHQNDESDGFWKDILSDENGYSISRYQQVIFTIVLGIGFVVNAYRKDVMIDFDQNLLILSGVSTATYLAVKLHENS